MPIVLNGTTGITTPNVSTDTSTLGPLTQALNLGSTGQIVFPATQNPSANANTLDDYEEGTWTTTVPTAVNITGTPTLSLARYTKVGNLVTVEGKFSVQTTTANTLTYWVFSLPFAAANESGACGCAKQENNFIVGAVSDPTAGTNNQAYISYPASAQMPSGTAPHSFSYTYVVA